MLATVWDTAALDATAVIPAAQQAIAAAAKRGTVVATTASPNEIVRVTTASRAILATETATTNECVRCLLDQLQGSTELDNEVTGGTLRQATTKLVIKSCRTICSAG